MLVSMTTMEVNKTAPFSFFSSKRSMRFFSITFVAFLFFFWELLSSANGDDQTTVKSLWDAVQLNNRSDAVSLSCSEYTLTDKRAVNTFYNGLRVFYSLETTINDIFHVHGQTSTSCQTVIIWLSGTLAYMQGTKSVYFSNIVFGRKEDASKVLLSWNFSNTRNITFVNCTFYGELFVLYSRSPFQCRVYG
jgi:hypothetical protein